MGCIPIMIMLFFKSRYRGFTLVESLVVLAIFTGFVAASAGVFLMAYRSQMGSYVEELDEQSNMRAAFELEYFFHSSLGFQLLPLVNEVQPLESDILVLLVPNSLGDIQTWEFKFIPDGFDTLGRVKGSLNVTPPGGNIYLYSPDLSLPAGRNNFFVMDNLGRVTYSWLVRASDADLPWQGNLSIAQ